MTSEEPNAVYSRSGRAVVVVGGLLLVTALILPWYRASPGIGEGALSGLALSGVAPELGLLAAIGVVAALAGALAPRVARGGAVRCEAAAALVLGVIGLAVAFEVVGRLNATVTTNYGLSFWNGLDVGWYLAVVGGFLLVAVGLLRWRFPGPTAQPTPGA
jgi:hypothetical protein